jgi:hypothetical protein
VGSFEIILAAAQCFEQFCAWAQFRQPECNNCAIVETESAKNLQRSAPRAQTLNALGTTLGSIEASMSLAFPQQHQPRANVQAQRHALSPKLHASLPGQAENANFHKRPRRGICSAIAAAMPRFC